MKKEFFAAFLYFYAMDGSHAFTIRREMGTRLCAGKRSELVSFCKPALSVANDQGAFRGVAFDHPLSSS